MNKNEEDCVENNPEPVTIKSSIASIIAKNNG